MTPTTPPEGDDMAREACPYDFAGNCHLETEAIGPCLCVNSARRLGVLTHDDGEPADQSFVEMLWKWFEDRGCDLRPERLQGLTADEFRIMLDEHEAALSLPDTARGREWQPIETAPKDGSKVDLLYEYPRGRTLDCMWRQGGVDGDGRWVWLKAIWGSQPGLGIDWHLLPESEWEVCSYPNMEPTHWMLPPSLPSAHRQPKEATAAQHFGLAKGESARFVRNGVLETCECRDCSSLPSTDKS